MTCELQFENEHVSVWKTVISSDQPLEMHQHSLGKVLIGLKGHQAYWLSGEGKQGEINLGEEPVEVIVVEMKRPQDRPLPSKPID